MSTLASLILNLRDNSPRAAQLDRPISSPMFRRSPRHASGLLFSARASFLADVHRHRRGRLHRLQPDQGPQRPRRERHHRRRRSRRRQEVPQSRRPADRRLSRPRRVPRQDRQGQFLRQHHRRLPPGRLHRHDRVERQVYARHQFRLHQGGVLLVPGEARSADLRLLGGDLRQGSRSSANSAPARARSTSMAGRSGCSIPGCARRSARSRRR